MVELIQRETTQIREQKPNLISLITAILHKINP